MALPLPSPGLVINYSYLWHDQKRRTGATEGRKDRPCAIVVATENHQGKTIVYVVPVTHAKPIEDAHAVALPPAAKRRLGLDDLPSWIVTSELNRFVWPGYDLRSIARKAPGTFAWGHLPVETFDAVKTAIGLHQRGKQLNVVGRD